MIVINYAQIRKLDIANGDGVRTSIFVSGCTIHCKNCFNPEYQNFNYGNKFTDNIKNLILEYLEDDNISGLSILGGEPLDQDLDILDLVKTVKEKFPNKDIWLWTGYTFEDIKESKIEILKNIDVLVDGKFIQELKDVKLKFRGSSNQRIINVQNSLKYNKTVLLDN